MLSKQSIVISIQDFNQVLLAQFEKSLKVAKIIEFGLFNLENELIGSFIELSV